MKLFQSKDCDFGFELSSYSITYPHFQRNTKIIIKNNKKKKKKTYFFQILTVESQPAVAKMRGIEAAFSWVMLEGRNDGHHEVARTPPACASLDSSSHLPLSSVMNEDR